jgi:transposase-like protein
MPARRSNARNPGVNDAIDLERVQAFPTRLIEAAWPSLWIDAVAGRDRRNGRIVAKAACVGVNATGRREVLVDDLGDRPSIRATSPGAACAAFSKLVKRPKICDLKSLG